MDDFTMTMYIAARPEEVWRAVVGDDGNRAVMFGSVLRGELTAGARFEYVGPGTDGDETVHVYGEVLAVEPERLLRLREHPGPSYRENHAELSSLLEWRIEPQGDAATKLDFRNAEWTPGYVTENFDASTWPMVLSSLKTFVETGKPIDYGW
jgi:uncharacterized protein YndB with AHSA1/START domain